MKSRFFEIQIAEYDLLTPLSEIKREHPEIEKYYRARGEREIHGRLIFEKSMRTFGSCGMVFGRRFFRSTDKIKRPPEIIPF